MKAHPCCHIQPRAAEITRQPTSRWHRVVELLSWILPTATLALIPKCPACVAAYIALATGIGISLPAAAYLRASLVVVCLASLLFIVVRRLRH